MISVLIDAFLTYIVKGKGGTFP